MNLEQGELFFLVHKRKSSDTEHRYGNLALNENEDQKKLQALLWYRNHDEKGGGTMKHLAAVTTK